MKDEKEKLGGNQKQLKRPGPDAISMTCEGN